MKRRDVKRCQKERFAEDQHPHKMSFIVYHSHEHKLQVTKWPSTDARENYTPAVLYTVYLEEPGHMHSLDQQRMRTHPLHTLRTSQKISFKAKVWSAVLRCE